MKSLRLMVAALIVVMSGAISFGQMHDHSKMTTKTDAFKVLGNCGMCKARIEKAAKIEGVDKADWNEESKVLKVEYNPSEVKSDDILKKVAEAGHDNEKFKASDETYKKLPGCCKYDRDTKL